MTNLEFRVIMESVFGSKLLDSSLTLTDEKNFRKASLSMVVGETRFTLTQYWPLDSRISDSVRVRGFISKVIDKNLSIMGF